MAFTVTSIAVNVLFIRKTDQVTAYALEIVAAQEFQGFYKQKIFRIEPVKNSLLKEMDVVVAGFTRQDITIALVQNTNAIEFLEVPLDIVAPIAKTAIAHEART